MKKYLYLLITFFATNSIVSQNELYINGNDGSNPTLYVTGSSGSTPTLYVKGEIINNQGDFQNVNGTIELTGNWTNTVGTGSSKYKSSGVENFSGTTNQILFGKWNGIGLNNQLNNVKLNNPTSVTLATNVNIGSNGSLEFINDAVIFTDTNTLYLRNIDPTKLSGYNVSGDFTKFVIGNLKRETSVGNSYDLPVGYANINTGSKGEGLQMATITITTASSDGSVEAKFNTGNTSNVPIIICPSSPTITARDVDVILNNGFWTISNSSNNISEFELKLDPADYTSLGSPVNLDYTIILNGGPTGADDCSGNLSALPITHVGLTSFSKWEIGASNDGSSLPVELLYLNAEGINNKFIQIRWSTVTETNNSGFELQRSLDGVLYEKITWIQGNGTTTNPSKYSFDDYSVLANKTYYYRLKQIDFDNNYEYSYKVSASINDLNSTISVSQFIPNPSIDLSSLEIQVNKNTSATIIMYNGIGQLLINQNFKLLKGKNQLPFSLGELATGIYHTTIIIEEESFSRKIIIGK